MVGLTFTRPINSRVNFGSAPKTVSFCLSARIMQVGAKPSALCAASISARSFLRRPRGRFLPARFSVPCMPARMGARRGSGAITASRFTMSTAWLQPSSTAKSEYTPGHNRRTYSSAKTLDRIGMKSRRFARCRQFLNGLSPRRRISRILSSSPSIPMIQKLSTPASSRARS